MALIVIRQLTLQAVQSATNFQPAQPFTAKRGTTPSVGVMFVNEDGSAYLFPAGALITLGFKPPNPGNTLAPGTTAFDGPYTISGSTAAAPDENGVYWPPIGFSGAALNAALGYNPPAINDDVLSVTLAGEVRVDFAGGIEKSQTFSANIFHDINTGTEGVVTATTVPYPLIWNTINALSGGLATDLDAQPTDGVAAYPTIIIMTGLAGVNDGGITFWQLQNRTDATVAGELQRPLDYDAVLNPVVWTKLL